jgi:hypothetical protein
MLHSTSPDAWNRKQTYTSCPHMQILPNHKQVLKNTKQNLRTEILDAVSNDKKWSWSNPAFKQNIGRDFLQEAEADPASNTMWVFWSEKTDHVPSSELSGVHFHIKLFTMKTLPTPKSQRLKRIWMTAGQKKSNMAH